MATPLSSSKPRSDDWRILFIALTVFLYGVLLGLKVEQARYQRAWEELRFAQVIARDMQAPAVVPVEPEAPPAVEEAPLEEAPVEPAPPAPAAVGPSRPLPAAWSVQAPPASAEPRTLRVTLTAYASLAAQTCGDACNGPDDPFITATNNWVRPGTIAVSRDLLSSELPYGTLVRVVSIDPGPGCNAWLPGQQAILPDILVVDDTMHPRKTQQIDVWMPNNQLALRWGRCTATVHVL